MTPFIFVNIVWYTNHTNTARSYSGVSFSRISGLGCLKNLLGTYRRSQKELIKDSEELVVESGSVVFGKTW